MKVTRRSPFSGKENTLEIDVTQEQLDEIAVPLRQRRLIQQIFPHLSPSEREFLINGYTQEDWDAMFPPGEEE